MTTRRELMTMLGAGAVLAGTPTIARAQTQAPPTDLGRASDADRPLNIVNLDLLEAEARKTIAPGRFAFIDGAGDQWTLRENRRAFNDFPILARRLQGVDQIDLRTQLMGHELAFPIIVAPVGGHGRFHANAEVATANGAGAAGTLYVSSGASNKTMEDIAQATTGPKWFQIYMNKDMELNRWLVQRAKAAGFSAIVLTADALGPGQADEFIRLGRPAVPGLRPGNHDPDRGGRGNFADFKRDISFKDIGFLREASGLPVVVKGILTVEDVRQSVAAGAAAVWISNHGGRQMDGVPASVTMLRSAVDAVEGRVPVILDSGVRRGIDVFKAIALGASAVAVGRPVVWGLIVGGGQGVKSVLTHIAGELNTAMLLSGVSRIGDIKRDFVMLPKA